jgi:hypothetical protein
MEGWGEGRGIDTSILSKPSIFISPYSQFNDFPTIPIKSQGFMINISMFRRVHLYQCPNAPFIFLHNGDDSPVMNKSLEELARFIRVVQMRERNETMEGICEIRGSTCACCGGEFGGVRGTSSNGGFLGV